MARHLRNAKPALLHASRYKASNNKRAESFISQIDEQIGKKIVQNSAFFFFSLDADV